VGFAAERILRVRVSSVLDRLLLESLRRRRRCVSHHVPTSAGTVHVLDRPERLRGSGGERRPILVLVHGLSASGVVQWPLLAHLGRAGMRLIIPDLVGHGSSERRPDLGPEAVRVGLGEALERMLDAPAVLVGNSLGGFAALTVALDRPRLVRGLVVTSPGGARLEADELDELRRLFRAKRHADALEFVDRSLARPDPRMRHLVARRIRRRFRRPEIAAPLRSVHAGAGISPEDLCRLDKPTLLVWGARDRILPRRHLDWYREHLPSHVEIETPSHFGYTPFLDDPRALAERILRFVDDRVLNASAPPPRR
jgi:pimeloyl-ACP methyl ester carboxylesterase